MDARTLTKKVVSVLLIVAMFFSLASCGKAKDKEDENHRFYRSDYINNLPDSIKSVNGTNGTFKGNKIYYTHLDPEKYTNSIYSYDIKTQEECCYWDGTKNQPDMNDPFAESISCSSFTPAPDGSVYVFFNSNRLDKDQVDMNQYQNVTESDIIDYLASNWYSSYDEAESAWKSMKSYYEDADGNINYTSILIQLCEDYSKHIDSYFIQEFKSDGTKGKRLDLETSGNLYCSCMAVDKKGFLYLNIDESNDDSYQTYILVVDNQGNIKGKMTLDDYISEFVSLADGSVAYVASATENTGFSLFVMDGETQTAKEGVFLGQSQPNKIMQMDENTYAYTLNQGLYELNAQTGDIQFLLNWMDVNISSSSVAGFTICEDGKIGVFTDNYTATGESYDVAILSEISAEEAKNVKTIQLECFSMNSVIESAVIDFNKKHTDYHISATQYYDYNSSTMDYDTAKDSFVTSIANRKDIDIVAFDSYSQMSQFAAKGLLTDLTPLMADDEQYGKEEILPNIVKACQLDDKIVALPTNFYVNTLVGKVSDVGKADTWTVEDVLKLMRAKDPTTKIIEYVDRATALQTMVSLNYNKYVNLVEGTCDFNNEEFADVLRFCEYFPETTDVKDDGETSEEKMQKGTLLLAAFSLPNFMEQQSYEAMYGEDINFVGYPTEGKSGGLMSFGSMVGITTNCAHPDLAWEYMKEVLVPPSDGYGYPLNYNGSILKADFDAYFDSQLNSSEYEGISYGIGSSSVNIHAPTQEDIDLQKKIILNITAVSDAVPRNVLNIIQEEAEAYYSGQKTVEDVCKIIQSRLTIYLSETD